MTIFNWSILTSGALLFLTTIVPASAQFEDDSESPVEITADSMEWLNDEGIAIARGNADAVQGRYTLSAQVLTAYMAEDASEGSDTVSRIRRIEAEGNVVLSTPKETAHGRTGTYDVERKVAILQGSVVLTQGDNVFHGQKLTMDLTTGRSRLEGSMPADPSENSGRVRAIFRPNDEQQ